MDSILKNYRLKCNITQKSIAKALGITPQRYSRMEADDKVPEKYMDALSELLHVRSSVLQKQLDAKNIVLTAGEITYYRKRKNLSVPELSEKSHIFPSMIYNWEYGKFSPSESNAEFLKTYLEIPDLIIFPDIVLRNENTFILEFEKGFLVVSKTPYDYFEMLAPYNKNIQFVYLLNEKISKPTPVTVSDDIEGTPRTCFPNDLTADFETGSFCIEFEDCYLLCNSGRFSDDELIKLAKTLKKELIIGISDPSIPLLYKLQDNYNKARFKSDIISEISPFFTSIQDMDNEGKIIGINSKYKCIVTYDKLNHEVIIPKNLEIIF